MPTKLEEHKIEHIQLGLNNDFGANLVLGPTTSTDNAIPRFDGTTGNLLQNSSVTIDDNGNISVPSGATVDGVDVSVHAGDSTIHFTVASIDHAAISNLNSTSYTHLTAVNHTDLTDGGSTTLHTHGIVNLVAGNWKVFYTNGTGVITELSLGAIGTVLSGNGESAPTWIDHGGLGGLIDDDHTGYALLAGRSGGQTLIGGTGSGDDLKIQSTSHGTKGSIFFGAAGNSAYDEVNDRLGIGIAVPLFGLDFESATAKFGADNPLYIQVGLGSPLLGFNAYYDAAWKFGKGSSSEYGGVLYYTPSDGNLSWWISSAAGNAGDTATLGQKLWLTQAGNLGIGKSPTVKVDVQGVTNTTILRTSIGSSGTCELLDTAGAGRFIARNSSGTAVIDLHSNAACSINQNLQTKQLTLNALDASHEGGELVFGAAGAYTGWVNDVYDSNLRWTQGSTIYMYLNTTGLAIGSNNTPAYRLDVLSAVSGYVARFINDGNNAANGGIIVQAGADDASGVTTYIMCLDGDGTTVGYIENSSGTFRLVDFSDVRGKENIVPTDKNALDILNQIQLVKFDRKKSKEHIPIGFVAQQVEMIESSLVSTGEDGYKGIAVTSFIPYLVKGLQEQQEQIVSLRNEVEALKGDR